MELFGINKSPGGVLEPHSVTSSKNHSVRPGDLRMHGLQPWVSTAAQRGLRGRWLGPFSSAATHPAELRAQSPQGSVPRIYHSRAVTPESSKYGNVSFSACLVSNVLYLHSHSGAAQTSSSVLYDTSFLAERSPIIAPESLTGVSHAQLTGSLKPSQK